MPPRARPVRLAVSFALAIAILLLVYRRQGDHDIIAATNNGQLPSSLSSSPAPPPLAAGQQTPAEASLAAAVYSAHAEAERARRKALHAAKAAAAALSKRVIVASVQEEDTDWARHELPAGWESWVYVADDASAALHPPSNKGREAGVFLWYLASQYDDLAETNVFLHAHRAGYPNAWHVDNEAHSNPLSVRRLRLDTVQRKGYVNLRCLPNPGCPDDLQPHRDPPAPHLLHEHAMPMALRDLFDIPPQDVPHVIAAPCCSQFAVSKTQIQKRPKEDYLRFYHWIRDTPLDDAVAGRVWEYLWHIVFGLPYVHCPEPFDCYCDVYGDGCLDGLDLG